jgi:hypothetical protein
LKNSTRKTIKGTLLGLLISPAMAWLEFRAVSMRGVDLSSKGITVVWISAVVSSVLLAWAAMGLLEQRRTPYE